MRQSGDGSQTMQRWKEQHPVSTRRVTTIPRGITAFLANDRIHSKREAPSAHHTPCKAAVSNRFDVEFSLFVCGKRKARTDPWIRLGVGGYRHVVAVTSRNLAHTSALSKQTSYAARAQSAAKRHGSYCRSSAHTSLPLISQATRTSFMTSDPETAPRPSTSSTSNAVG
jgi:hypothetical protein